MRRCLLPAILVLLLALAPPAAGQNQPFRVVNRTPLPAVALHVAPSGEERWGANLLNRGPLAPGAGFSLCPGDGCACLLDLRLVLADGTEVVRRGADICAGHVFEITGGGPQAAPSR